MAATRSEGRVEARRTIEAVGFRDQVRAGIRSVFTVEHLVNQGITYGVTIIVTVYFGIRYDLPWWAWILVGVAVLLIVGAIALMVRKPKPAPAGASIEPTTAQEDVKARLWGPKPGDPATLTDDELRAEAKRLAREVRKFREEHAKALPPLEWIRVPGEPEKLEQFKAWRDADAVETYERSFQERVATIYEELVRRRGFGHPMMQNRYNNVRLAGEIDTVVFALEDMANPEPEGPPPPLREDDGRRIQVLMTRAPTPDTNIDPGDTTGSGWRAGTPEGYGWQVVQGGVVLRPPEGAFGSRRAAENDARKYRDENLDGVPIEHV